tara:strand:+ start:4422 stop:5324 length:903 start_codon:yes stop_codon:yes gene_type:complete
VSDFIINRVQMFLAEANKASVDVSDQLIEEFGEACKDAFRKQFTEERETEFRYRMSNVGRPLCQLQMEQSGAEAEAMPYNAKMRNLFGDLIEAAAITIMSASGLELKDIQKKTQYKFDDKYINGTMDVKIGDKIWDIKSASPWSFENKFGESGGFETLKNDDAFGYLAQGYLYGEGEKADFGGWIVINKSTGEWCSTEVPPEDISKKEIVDKAKESITALESKQEFKRCFSDVEESFYKKPTGNRVLGRECSFCPYKRPCWGDQLQYLPQQQSKSKNPKWVWYTQINNPRVDDENEQSEG